MATVSIPFTFSVGTAPPPLPFIRTPYDQIPNFGADPTITAVKSGMWSDPAVWGGQPPRTGYVVSIPAGVTVDYEKVSDVRLDTVAIQAGGVLQFNTDASTRLRVTNLLVMEGGTLTVGTDDDPVMAGATAEVIFNDTPFGADDPEQYGHGLIALGTVKMYGQPVTPFVRLAKEPRAGDSVLTLASPVIGWKAGDRLILPDTRMPLSNILANDQLEKPTVVSVSGNVVTLSAPLAFDHLGGRNAANTIDFMPVVGHTTRNVNIHSENPNGTRGYCYFTGRPDLDIEYAAFGGLGRTTNGWFDNTTFDAAGNVTHVGTNQEGRYPVYFDHVLGTLQPNGSQGTFMGNVISCPLDPMPYRWGLTVDDSHYLQFFGNVVFNWAGAGVVTVTGNETGNVFAGNFVVQITGDGNRGDGGLFHIPSELGHEGAAFWFRGGNNHVRDNVVANAGIYAYQIMPTGAGTVLVPADQGSEPSVPLDPQQMPLLEFARNEAFGTHTGLDIWGVGADITEVWDIGQSAVKDFKAWNVFRGFFAYPLNNFLFDGWVIRTGQFGNVTIPQGIAFGDYLAANVIIQNCDVQNAYFGIILPAKQGDTESKVPGGPLLIDSCKLVNHINVNCTPMGAVTGGGVQLPPRLTRIRNTIFGTHPHSAGNDTPRADIRMEWRFITNPNIRQLDQLFVEGFNGVKNDDFQVFFNEQRADFVMPQTDPNTGLIGSPDAGKTNAENWKDHGIAIGGSVMPADAVARDGIVGMVKPSTP